MSVRALYGWNSTYNLWEIQGIVADRIEDQILELVDHSKQVLSQCRHG